MSESVGVAVLVLGIFLFVIMVAGLLLATPTPSATSLKLEPPPLPPVSPKPDVLEQLQRLGQGDRTDAAENAKSRRWLRSVGFLARLLTYLVLFLLLYIWAPKDISNTPLAALTLSDIVKTVAFVAIGIVLVRALFSPADSDEIKDAWGWLGVVLLAVFSLGALYIYKTQ